MEEILIMASVIAPVTAGVVEGTKKSLGLQKRFMPLIALVIGLALGAAAFPFTDAIIAERLWAGGISGLAAVGLFELSKSPKKDD